MLVHIRDRDHAVILEDEGVFLQFGLDREGEVDVTFIPPKQRPNLDGMLPPISAVGCAGVLRWKGVTYLLIVVLPVDSVGGLGEEAERVEEVLFLDISGKIPPTASSRLHPCFHLHRLLVHGSFYYSKTFDMTTRFENRVKVQQHHLAACTPQSRHGGTAYYSPPWLSGTPEFEWNYFLLEPLRRSRDTLDHRQRAWWNSRFFELSLSQGYFGCRELGLGGEKVLLTVVSRRGWRRAGTRFEKRGIDEEGNVANFVETETILQSPSRAIAFTQVRGSVPLVWQERLYLTGPVDLSIAQPVLPSSLQSFQRHINHLVMSYRQIHILSLLSDLDSGRLDAEAILGDAYCLLFWTRAQLGDRRAEDVVSFQSYPIHVDQLDSARAQSLPAEMEQNLKAVLDVLGATVSTIDGEGRMTLKEEQRGVFRVNCRDCLDRSNLAAYSLSAATLKLRYGVDAPDLALTSEDAQQLAKAHRELFAENGDALSQFYAGSAAMNSDLIRTGVYSSPHQEVTNAWNAEKRNGQAIFHDKAKNRAIEVLTGQYRKQESQPVLVRFDKKDGFLVVPELSDAPSASFPFFPPPVARS